MYYGREGSPIFVRERKNTVGKQETTLNMFRSFSRGDSFLKTVATFVNPLRVRTIDKSQVPVLDEKDLEESFIRGGGPGGQKVNKGNNCVFLVHKPTGLRVKVHESRFQEQNRKIARQRLTTLLDNMLNKENSVENQKKEMLNEKSLKRIHKQKRLMELKNKWKQLISEYS